MTRYALGLILAIVAVAATGCQNKFTRERFNMIEVGVDTHEDVRYILGNPASDLEDMWFYDDLDEHYSAMIHFDNAGTVSGKQWLDSITGDWKEQNRRATRPRERGELRQHRTKTRRYDD